MAAAANPPDLRPEDWLVGGGEMGKLVRSKDWSQTPLGPIESWPQSLRTTVSLCLASNFPISLAWGPQHVQIYNDGYWPICGGKHPQSMGQDFRVCWASPWPVIGAAFERALAGETSYLEDQRMFLDRNGYLEETFFTFSFSPIRDESGGVGGLFHPVMETTPKMLGERRTRALRDLAGRTAKARTTEEALEVAAQTLSEYPLDVPFALFYSIRSDRERADLVTQTVAAPESLAIPTLHASHDPAAPWPLVQVLQSKATLQVTQLVARVGPFICAPYPEPPHTALLMPITPPGSEHPVGFMVAAVSARLPLNDVYLAFNDLMAAAVTAAVANARAYEEERKRAEALAEIDRAKTAFFSNVSHEFRTPLTLMLGPLEDELAEHESPLPPARRERLQTAYRNTLRLMKLVNALLDFSRIEAGRIDASFAPTDLSHLTAELASVFRSAIERGGLSLDVDCPVLSEPIYIDRDMWEKVVLNLLSNAFKHTFEGSIRVSMQESPEHVAVCVQDSGIGIPPNELPRLFDRFHRVKGSKSRTHEGSGIGLALVQELVRIHDGIVEVQSEEGEGSTFVVRLKKGYRHLPSDRVSQHANSTTALAARAAAYVEEALQWTSTTASPADIHIDRIDAGPLFGDEFKDAPLQRPRILWSDDNADMRQYVARLLGDYYEVIAVADGLRALSSAREQPPDLILTDVMMPGLDGFGLLRELRADERTRTIPVILLSARAGEESAVEGLQAGADDYMVKPFSARELVARVRTHLELGRLRREWAVTLEHQVTERTNELLSACNALEIEISERKEAQRKLIDTQQLVMQQERLRALGEMASGIAHDINNAISPIALYTETMLETERSLSERAQGYLRTIQLSISDVAQTIARMRDFYRKRPVEVALAPTQLNLLVRQVIDFTRARWSDIPQERGVSIHVVADLPADLPLIMGIEGEVREALTNLIFNAVDAMPDGGTLTIRTRIDAGADESNSKHVSLEVSDTGVGMDEETRRRCLEPFFTTKGEQGTGLGLAMVYGMAERHGARVHIESAKGSGTTVGLSFVCSQRADVPETTPSTARSRPLRILLVDDEELVLQSLRDALAVDGHVATGATEGAQGLKLLREAQSRAEPFDLVITDLGMPHMDGRQVAAAVSKLSPQTPVVLLTGWGERLVAEGRLIPHVARILSKPPKLRELREAIAACSAELIH
jgi:signal transduction histidine kinase